MGTVTQRAASGGGSAAELSFRASVLGFLAELWLVPPCPRHLEGLACLAELAPDQAAPLAVSEDDLEAVARAWQHHLRVPGPANLLPYECSHLPAGVTPRGPTRLAQIAGIYRAAGFELEPFTQFPADHLGHELRFLAALAARKEVSSPDAARNLSTWERGFLGDHLGVWVNGFCEAAASRGAHPFLVALARLSARLPWELDGVG